MRLVCPNCEAKYEVPEDAIPETGRDVQCANCGHAWYQMRSRAPVAETAATAPAVAPPAAVTPEAERVAEPETLPEPTPEPLSEPVEPELEVMQEAMASQPEAEPAAEPEPVEPEPAAEPEPEPETVEAPVVETVAEVGAPAEGVEPAAEDAGSAVEESPAAVAETDVVSMDAVDGTATGDSPAEVDEGDDAPGAAQVAAAAVPAAYAVDESVLAILREEAEREAQVRRAEAAKPLEVQADLGIDAAMPAAKKPVDVLSVDAGPAAQSEDADEKHAGRRTRLPDVEEINSTLRPSEFSEEDETASEAAAAVTEGRSSFRSGFLVVLTIAILGSAIYTSADAIADVVPALAGPLKSYVGFIDSLRLQLDGLMQSATVAINGT